MNQLRAISSTERLHIVVILLLQCEWCGQVLKLDSCTLRWTCSPHLYLKKITNLYVNIVRAPVTFICLFTVEG